MNKEQAERKAAGFNRLARHPMISYKAGGMDPTRWERRDRWGVVQMYDGHVVGIAAT